MSKNKMYEEACQELASAQEDHAKANMELQEEQIRSQLLHTYKAKLAAEAETVAKRRADAQWQMANIRDKLDIVAAATKAHTESRRMAEKMIILAKDKLKATMDSNIKAEEERSKREKRVEAHVEKLNKMFPRIGVRSAREEIREMQKALLDKEEKAKADWEREVGGLRSRAKSRCDGVDAKIAEVAEQRRLAEQELERRNKIRIEEDARGKAMEKEAEDCDSSQMDMTLPVDTSNSHYQDQDEDEISCPAKVVAPPPVALAVSISPAPTPTPAPVPPILQIQTKSREVTPRKQFSLAGGERLSLPSIRRQTDFGKVKASQDSSMSQSQSQSVSSQSQNQSQNAAAAAVPAPLALKAGSSAAVTEEFSSRTELEVAKTPLAATETVQAAREASNVVDDAQEAEMEHLALTQDTQGPTTTQETQGGPSDATQENEAPPTPMMTQELIGQDKEAAEKMDCSQTSSVNQEPQQSSFAIDIFDKTSSQSRFNLVFDGKSPGPVGGGGGGGQRRR